jgi:hypothetical protein
MKTAGNTVNETVPPGLSLPDGGWRAASTKIKSSFRVQMVVQPSRESFCDAVDPAVAPLPTRRLSPTEAAGTIDRSVCFVSAIRPASSFSRSAG